MPVDRPPGQNTANLVLGTVSTPTERYPEGMRRVVLIGDPTKALGAIAEPECRRVLAALELARRLDAPVEWFAVSAGAKIAMDSGTENMDWISRVLRGIIEFTQDGGEINVVVTGINVGAQPYWNAEATMLMHTKGILVMTPDSAMVLTGKQSLDYSGGVSRRGQLRHRRLRPDHGPERAGPVLGAGPVRRGGRAARALRAHLPGARRAVPAAGPDHRPGRPGRLRLPARRARAATSARSGEIFTANPERKKPFDIRSVLRAVADADHPTLERWVDMIDAEGVVVLDAHLGGQPVALLGIESRPLPRRGRVPVDGPTSFTAGTLFPRSSKKTARAINAASGNRPLVVLANLSGFDGSPESLRGLQLEYGAEIGRAVVNFRGPIVFCVVSRYHGGAFVVFSATLNDSMEVAAVEGSYASVIGGAPAAAVVFAGEVNKRTAADPRIAELEARDRPGPRGRRRVRGRAADRRAGPAAARGALGEARRGRRRVRRRAQRAAGAPDGLGARDHPRGAAAAVPDRRGAPRDGTTPDRERERNRRKEATVTEANGSEQRVAIVTGGARGIGAAITTALANSGVHVAAGYASNSKAADELAGKLNAEGASVSVHQGNVGEPEDCQRVVQEVLDAKGRVDILVNNAGITVDKTMRKMSIDDWHAVLRINLSGAFYMSKAVLDHMLERKYGRIINISSVIGQMGNIGQVNYAASKAGLFGFSQSMARETAFKGITVNCVAPGYIATEMVAAVPEAAMEKILAKIPVGRLGEAHEIARAVQFLADDDAGFITGSVISVNGGMDM